MLYSKILFEKGIIKNRKMLTQSQITGMKFIGTLENTKHFYNSIRALNFNENGIFVINNNGFKLIVEESKYVQATLYMTRESFLEFQFNGNDQDDEIWIGINLNVFTECLSINSGIDHSLKIMYKGVGSALVIVMIQNNDVDDLTTECSIKTKNYQEPLDFNLNEDSPTFNRIIMRGADVSNILNEINKNANELELNLSPTEPHIKFKTFGVIQSETNVEIAKTSDMILLFSCNTKYKNKFKLSHIRLAMRAIALAQKIAIRTDSSGLLSLHMMIVNDGNATICIEYFITPLIDDNDDD